jgi:hypothetical protein
MIPAIMIWIPTYDTCYYDLNTYIWYDTIWYDTIDLHHVDLHHVDSCRFNSILTSYPSLFFKFALKLFNLHPPHYLPQQTYPKLKYVMRVLVKQKLKCASIFKVLFIVGANMLLRYVTMMLRCYDNTKRKKKRWRGCCVDLLISIFHLHQDQE